MPSKTWRGGSGDWSDPENWIGGVPARGDTVGVSSSASVADDQSTCRRRLRTPLRRGRLSASAS